MKRVRIQMALLAGLFSVLMSLPYLIPHFGLFALIAFVPLLWMEKIANEAGIRKIWPWHYGAFVAWNALTTFWVCNATVGGGIFAILANALQMSVIFGLFRLSRKAFKGVLPYILLGTLWIAWERAYFSAQISWPWLTLGNSFAGTAKLAQWYEYTGSLGGSLWIWLTNLSVFALISYVHDGRFSRFNSKAKFASVAFPIAAAVAPIIVSLSIYNSYTENDGEKLEVVLLQPNIDPYNKFQALSQSQQNAILEGQIVEAIPDRKWDSTKTPLLLLAPETFTNDVVTNDITEGRTIRRFTNLLSDYPGVNLIFGAGSITYYFDKKAPSHTARHTKDGFWFESHNSALIADGSGRAQIFHKGKLVPAVEMTPYPAFFCKIDDLLGGVMGRCIGQGEISLLDVSSVDNKTIPVGSAICYESVFGEYCTGYTKKGAKAIVIITNDAWWGDSPGYMQHLRYASLRAIENRRDIARCANTGISAFINQRGDVVEKSNWWEKQTLRGIINLNDGLTFFVQNGDIVGRICTFVSLLMLIAAIVGIIISKKR